MQLSLLSLVFAIIAACHGSATANPAEAPLRQVDGLSQAAIQTAFQILRGQYIRSHELTFDEINRAAMQGLLQRMHLGAELLDRTGTQRAIVPTGVLAELMTPEIVYLRPLSFASEEVGLISDRLTAHARAGVRHLILDLRSPAAPAEFPVAAALLDLFIPRGEVLFRLKQVGREDSELYLSNQAPIWSQRLVALVDEDTNNVGETIAAVLRHSGRAVIVGSPTRGATVRYETAPLDDHWLLRFARAEMLLADGTSLFGKGVQPDHSVPFPIAAKRAVFDLPTTIKEIKDTITELPPVRYNEAALIARKNPELDRFIQQSRPGPHAGDEAPPKDLVLQRAVDMLRAQSHFAASQIAWPPADKTKRATVRKAAPAPKP